MAHKYCKYCVTELRGSYYRVIGVCNYCDKNPARRRRYTRTQESTGQDSKNVTRFQNKEKSIEELKQDAEKFKNELDKKFEDFKQEMRKLLE